MVTKIKPTGIDETLDYSFDEVSANSMVITGNSTITGTTSIQQISEKIIIKESSTGTVEHDFTEGAIFYHKNISSDFVINVTNLPETGNQSSTFAVFLEQGFPAYYPTEFQIDSSAQTVKWLNGVAGVGTSNTVDIITYTCMRINDSWEVFSQYSYYE